MREFHDRMALATPIRMPSPETPFESPPELSRTVETQTIENGSLEVAGNGMRLRQRQVGGARGRGVGIMDPGVPSKHPTTSSTSSFVYSVPSGISDTFSGAGRVSCDDSPRSAPSGFQQKSNSGSSK